MRDVERVQILRGFQQAVFSVVLRSEEKIRLGRSRRVLERAVVIKIIVRVDEDDVVSRRARNALVHRVVNPFVRLRDDDVDFIPIFFENGARAV